MKLGLTFLTTALCVQVSDIITVIITRIHIFEFVFCSLLSLRLLKLTVCGTEYVTQRKVKTGSS